MIATLLKKDVKLYVRNRLYSFLTVASLLAYIVIYFLVPNTTNDELSLGVVLEVSPDRPLVQAILKVMEPEIVESEEALKARLEEGELLGGFVLTPAILAQLEQDQPTNIPLYLAPGTPAYLQEALADIISVTINDLISGGRFQRFETTEEVLGPDLLGKPLSLRQRMLPMLIFVVMLIETLGLASLINLEVVADTARALLVTPLRMSQFFTAKALMGVGLAVGQVLILLTVTGQIQRAPLQLFLLVLAGSLLITGVSFLIAAIARDYMGILAWGVVFLIPLMLPSLTVIFPGLANRWIEWIPSFFFVDGLHRALNFQASLADLATALAGQTAAGLALLGLGTALLRRRFQ